MKIDDIHMADFPQQSLFQLISIVVLYDELVVNAAVEHYIQTSGIGLCKRRRSRQLPAARPRRRKHSDSEREQAQVETRAPKRQRY